MEGPALRMKRWQVNCRETEELYVVHIDRFSQERGAGFHMQENFYVKKKNILLNN